MVDRKVNFAETDWLTKRTGTNSCASGDHSFIKVEHAAAKVEGSQILVSSDNSSAIGIPREWAFREYKFLKNLLRGLVYTL